MKRITTNFRPARQALRRFSTMTQVQKLRRQNSIPASYYRGGTSRAIMLRREDLPSDQSQWDPIFLGCIGSPDPYWRQLDGMGGGISSLSKVCVVGESTHPEADVDYTFVSLGIDNANVDYSSNCGNMLGAVGPYAIDAGITEGEGHSNGDESEVTVRIHNTNTGKIIHSTFAVVDGEAAAYGPFEIDGVAGTAAPVKLQFIRPAGSRTGKLLPTGSTTDTFNGIRATCIDAANPCVFVSAAQLGVPGDLTPQQIDDHPTLKSTLESIRRAAAVRMGFAASEHETPGSVPKIAIVAPPADPSRSNIEVRALSVGQPHKAIPVTVALAIAAAAKLEGTNVFEAAVKGDSDESSPTVIRHASGVLGVDGKFSDSAELESATVFRTARRLMEGRVFWK
ncbi:DUF453 domain protein [Xylaria bambusicola]|uniref:DUF453 domain protein n=1 Tax=Xylaria bambusicola TaxID=326684 RepID=UPI00200753F5|nr:DUF453 domain protein [Xylaria bambusicola]KAI0517356.1 DUF453 domain protein [Xylaria bambusicola]